ncbi:MAG: methyltransferase [Proteobacteria bacterium]|nr:methyltransferase [Pseudomonadota bacterium]
MEKLEIDSSQSGIPPQARVFEILIGFMRTQAVHAAARFGLPDLLRDGPRTAEDMALRSGLDPEALYRLLAALADLGLFEERPGRGFELTDLGRTLCNDTPGSLRPFALLAGDRMWWGPWGSLTDSLKTGRPAFDVLFGTDYTGYLDRHGEMGRIHDACLDSVSLAHNPAVLAAYDFSSFSKVVDVGGGQGSLLASVLEAYSVPAGVLFDRPRVVEAAAGLYPNLKGRLEFRGGDFFEGVPSGGDLYMLKQVLHDWDDRRAARILENCRKATGEQGLLIVIESVIEPGAPSPVPRLFDLHMLVTSGGGRERTLAEFRALFQAGGFEMAAARATPSSFFILEGRPR